MSMRDSNIINRHDRKLALSFGAVVLILMLAASGAASYLFYQLNQKQEDRLSGMIAVILGESISRVSFSGKYHARLFVEEMQSRIPELAFISVETKNGLILAHSDPVKNDEFLTDRADVDLRIQSLKTGAPANAEHTHNGKTIKEVVLPYRGGPDAGVIGFVHIGIRIDDVRKEAQANIIRLLILVAALTAAAIGGIFMLSSYFGGAVRALANQLQGILNHAPMAISISDRAGRILAFSAGFEHLFGRPAVKQTQMHLFAEHFSDSTVKSLAESDRNVIEKGVPCEQELEVDIQGRSCTWNVSKFPIASEDDGKTTLICAFIHDITERKQAEKEIQHLAERLKLATDAASIGIWDWDLKEDRYYATPTYFTMLGYEPDEDFIDREQWLLRSHPEDRAAVEDKVSAVLAGSDEPYQYEARILHADGSYRWINVVGRVLERDEQGKAARMLGVRIDITERKLAEDALRDSEEKYRLLVENATEAIMVAQDGMLRFVNRKTEELLGYSKDEITSTPFVNFIIPEDRGMVMDRHQRRMRGEELPDVYPFRIVDKEGAIKWVEINLVVISWKDRPASLNFLVEITERKRAEDAVLASESLLNSIIDQSPYPIWISDDKGTLIRINKACLDLLQITEEEVVGKYNIVKDNIVEEQGFLPLVRRVFEKGDTVRYEIKYDTSKITGLQLEHTTYVILDVTMFPIKDALGRIINVVIQHIDITERKRAEEALRESEERYRLITDNITDVVLTTDIEGAYTFISSSHKRVLDRGEEVLGRSVFEYIHPEDIPHVVATFEEAVKNRGIARTEFRYLHPSRGYIWLESQGMVIDMHGSETGVIVSRDITDRKHAEEALQKSEERLSQLFDNMGNCSVVYEAVAGGDDFIIKSFNRAAERLEKVTRENIQGKSVQEVFPGVRQFGLLDVFKRVWKTGQPEHHPVRLYQDNRISGWRENFVYRLPSGEVVAIYDDITQRKQTEEELREQHDILSQVVETGPIGITFVDAKGKINFANTRAEEILGLSKTHITQLDYKAPDWRITGLDGKPFPAEDLPFMLVQNAMKPVKDIQHAIEWPDGRRVLLSINGAPLFSATGEFSGMVATFEDITERKMAEEERIKLEERLQQSYKMEAIGSLAGGIAHDFNNILSSVFGFAELAKMKLEDRANIENELDEILKAGVRARDLVKQILTFSRQAGIKREPMVVVPLIKETLKFIRASLPVTIEIRQDFPVSHSMIIADPTQIHQVIMNLCTNAAHAMKEKGGMLDVRLAEVELNDEAELDFKGLKQGRYLRLSVTDTGSGIPKDVIKRIFDPFFTTKERGEGTGMGLSVVHGIVKEMGGAISVYSDPGIGTTFNILFPLYQGVTVEAQALNTFLTAGSGRILFVDDEEGVIASGRGILEQLGYTITSTTSPMEALTLFTSDPDSFDLVLTDLTMPKMTGLELSERLREIRPDIPIVLCTGFSLGISPERIRDAGISEMVMKPMVASELSEAVYKSLNPAGG